MSCATGPCTHPQGESKCPVCRWLSVPIGQSDHIQAKTGGARSTPRTTDRTRGAPSRQNGAWKSFTKHHLTPEYLAVRGHLPAPWQDILDIAYYSGWRKQEILVNELLEARDDKHLLRVQKQLAKQDLLIVDELGYVPLSKTGAELLFEVFSRRYEQASTLVTSNLPFNEWTEIFGSERLTGALLDRLTHHVHILELNGESYRLAHSKKARPPQPPRRPEASLRDAAPPAGWSTFPGLSGFPNAILGPFGVLRG